jgi:fumarate reductase subunit C
MVRRAYVRPMQGWWRRDPFFMRYMAREATAPFVVAYALVLLAGLVRLSRGEQAFGVWLEGLSSPVSIGLHAILLAIFLYHTYTWFQIMPKTLPPIEVAGRRLKPGTITLVGMAASAVLSLALLFLLLSLAA